MMAELTPQPEYFAGVVNAAVELLRAVHETRYVDDMCDLPGMDTVTRVPRALFAIINLERARNPLRLPFGDSVRGASGANGYPDGMKLVGAQRWLWNVHDKIVCDWKLDGQCEGKIPLAVSFGPGEMRKLTRDEFNAIGLATQYIADVLNLLTPATPAQVKMADGDPERKPQAPAANPALESGILDYVDLDQAAALVNRSKKTLERALVKKIMPPPDIEGGGGKKHEWVYAKLRPWLETSYGKVLPNRPPRAIP